MFSLHCVDNALEPGVYSSLRRTHRPVLDYVYPFLQNCEVERNNDYTHTLTALCKICKYTLNDFGIIHPLFQAFAGRYNTVSTPFSMISNWSYCVRLLKIL